VQLKHLDQLEPKQQKKGCLRASCGAMHRTHDGAPIPPISQKVKPSEFLLDAHESCAFQIADELNCRALFDEFETDGDEIPKCYDIMRKTG
jgi:hypothetical protein